MHTNNMLMNHISIIRSSETQQEYRHKCLKQTFLGVNLNKDMPICSKKGETSNNFIKDMKTKKKEKNISQQTTRI